MDALVQALEREHAPTTTDQLKNRLEALERTVSWLFQQMQPDAVPQEANNFNSIADVQKEISRFYGFTRLQLCSPSRNTSLVRARHIAFYLCRTRTICALTTIGKHFGQRDHTTVLHGVQKIGKAREWDRVLQLELNALEENLSKIDPPSPLSPEPKKESA